MNDYHTIEKNYYRISEECKTFHARLLLATKTIDSDTINFAIDKLGAKYIGENRVQELEEKYALLHRENIRLHLIGSLQTNKVKYLPGMVDMIESLDSIKLADHIEKQFSKTGKTVDCLIEINIAGEPNKSGIDKNDLMRFADDISSFEHIKIKGVMTMAPQGSSEKEYASYFTETYKLYESLIRQFKITDPVLSMGMSDSYKIALECGSNLVRIGSGIFGKRKRI